MFGRGRPRHPDILTPAEWRVLELVREGKTNAEIAVSLGISVNTVKYHVANMLAKLELPDRRALARWTPKRQGFSLGWLGKAALVTGGAAAVVVAAAALSPGRDSEAAADLEIAFVAAGPTTAPTLRVVASATGEERVVAPLPTDASVDTVRWSPGGVELIVQTRRVYAIPGCPQFASCPPFVEPAVLHRVGLEDGVRLPLASGLNAASIGALLGWDGGKLILAVFGVEGSEGDGVILMDLQSTRCMELSLGGTRAACTGHPEGPDGRREIHIIERSHPLDFTAPAFTLTSPAATGWPRLSPDGRWLAWNTSSGIHLASLPATGTAGRPQVLDLGDGGEATWSPRGDRFLYFRLTAANAVRDVWVYDTATHSSHQVSVGGAREAVWSPDGSQIAYISEHDHGPGDIYVVNADGSGLERLTDNDLYESHLAWGQ